MELVFFLVVANLLIYKVTDKPKSVLFGKGSLKFYLNYTLKAHGLKKFLLRIAVAIFRPMLTDDRANVFSLLLFVNLSIILIFLNPNDYIKNVSYSVIGAVIFQYFVIMLPQEKKKVLGATSFMSSCRTMREREKVLFEVLGYKEPKLFVHALKDDDQDFINKFVTALKTNSPIGKLNGLHQNKIEPYSGGYDRLVLPDRLNFVALLKFIHEQDLGSIQVIEQNPEIYLFDKMQSSLHDYKYQLGSLNYFDKQNPEDYAVLYLRYLKGRQRFLVSYHRSAHNYIHEHDEDYLLSEL